MSFLDLPFAVDPASLLPTSLLPTSLLPTSRKEAKALGATRYFSGKPCRKGHVAARKTGQGSCVECQKAILARWHEAHKEQQSVYRKAYYDANADDMRKRSREWMAANKERKRDNQRAWDAANCERKNENIRRWRSENPDKVREINRRAYANNLPAIRAGNKRWRSANPDKLAAISQNRRAKIAASGGAGVSADDIAELKRRQRACVDCGRKFGPGLKPTIDHVMPLAKGGKHDPRNLELRCRRCNSRKHARDPIQHAQLLGRLL